MKKQTGDTIDMEFDGEKFKAVDMNKYAENYSEDGFFDKIKGTLKSAGLKIIYEALQLFYVTQNPNCPMKIKAGIFAALGYFISPIDLIPDFIPVAGYTDDGAAILLALTMAQIYIDDNVRRAAKNKIAALFGESAVAELN